MSFKESFNFFDSDEGSNSSFNQSNLIINNSFPSSNFPLNIFSENITFGESLNAYPFPKKNKNNEEPSLLNNSSFINNKDNKDNDKEKEANLIVNKENKSDESKDEGKSKNKNTKKILFNIDDSLSTTNQTQNKKLKKEKPLVKVNKDKNKKNNERKGDHNKYSDDNIRRKCKFIILSYVKDFINKKIDEKCNDKGYGINTKKLMTLNKRQVSNANIEFNKAFMGKTLAILKIKMRNQLKN